MKPERKPKESQRPVVPAIENPYLHFIMSEGWAALAASASYGLFHLGAYLAQRISELMPLTDKAPAAFLESTLSWGAAISSSATFITISAYQLFFLIRRLWEKFQP